MLAHSGMHAMARLAQAPNTDLIRQLSFTMPASTAGKSSGSALCHSATHQLISAEA